MAANKKYAGLPDLDDAGTELYQTPGLTDDASTVQTSTLRTESSAPASEDGDEHFDRTMFDRNEARRRFEPAVVDARDVNFSYAVGGQRKSYISRHRRRRRGVGTGVDEYGDESDGSDVERDESLGQRLARLKREAEEVRVEIERREKEDGEFQDSFEHQDGGGENDENDAELNKGIDDLTRILSGLQTSMRPKRGGTFNHNFSTQPSAGDVSRKNVSQSAGTSQDIPQTSDIAAIGAFSDRLTAIESALGLSTLSPASPTTTTAILPTLDTLTNQLNLLYTTIAPKLPTSSQPNTTSTITPQIPHLDILQSRLHTLHQSSSTLLTSRKAAQAALEDLETVRLRGIRSADHLARYQTLANKRFNRAPTSYGPITSDDYNDDDSAAAAVTGTTGSRATQARRPTAVDDAKERLEIADEIVTPLFLEDQAEKIKALYNVLPTIQDLQPLLPVVLERLRALSVVHAGAARAREDMDEIEARVAEWEAEMVKWRTAVEGVEAGIAEAETVMEENMGVVGGMVQGVEERIARLERMS